MWPPEGSSRQATRGRSAEYLNRLTSDELFACWRITRVSDLTGLDEIGIPVYSVCRPEGQAVSVNAGKALKPELARAGAIAEGAEFYSFENPDPLFKRKRVYVRDLAIDPSLLPWVKGADKTQRFEVEPVTNSSGGWTQFPSDILWLGALGDRGLSELFQQNSNGNAVGSSFSDAHLSGIYECVERDAVSQWKYRWDTTGQMPPLVSLEEVPQPALRIIEAILKANLQVMVCYCTRDINLPVFWAIILDPYGGLAPFAGWGCAIDPAEALERALLEACQSRAVFISGARDDVLRRDFEFLQNMDQVTLANTLAQAPKLQIPFCAVFERGRLSLQEELSLVRERLGIHRSNLYYLTVSIPHLIAVKTVILGLEQPQSVRWTPSLRTLQWLESTPFISLDQVSTGEGSRVP